MLIVVTTIRQLLMQATVPMPAFKTSFTMRSTTSLQNTPLRSLHNPNQQFLFLCPSNKANEGRVAMGTTPVFLASTTITPLPTTTTTEEEEQENHKKNTSRNLKFKHGKTSKQNKASKQDKSSKQNTISRTLSFSWLQLGVDIAGEASWDESGDSVSLSADGKTVAAIGAVGNDGNVDVSGHTRVFRWNQSKNMWEQMGNDMDGEAIFDGSGTSVSLSSDGRTVAIGAVGNDGNGITSRRGHTRVFRWIQSKNIWEQMGNDMDGETSGDLSGNSVSLSSDGETVAIGAYGNGGNGSGGGSGHTRVFKWNPFTKTWVQMGNDMDGEQSGDSSGRSVSFLSSNGEIVAIGAHGNDGNGSISGHTRVFKWNPFTKTWEQMGNDIDGESSFDYSGESVSLSANGMTVAIGARYNDGNGNQSGHTRVFRWNQSKNTWQQMGKDVDGEATSGDASGWSVSLSSDGEIVAIGALGNDGNGIGSGHTCVFRWNPSTNTWEQMGKDIMDGEAIDDKSGSSVSLSANGETVAIGAVGNDGNGSGSGHVRVYSVTGGP